MIITDSTLMPEAMPRDQMWRPGITPRITGKARINRVRRMAKRQGFFVNKSIDRCPWSCSFNRYAVYPWGGGPAVFGYTGPDGNPKRNATLEDVEAWLVERASAAPSPSKVLENRVRRVASRCGLILRRSRRRDPRSEDYAAYSLLDAEGITLAGPGDLSVIERHLSVLRA